VFFVLLMCTTSGVSAQATSEAWPATDNAIAAGNIRAALEFLRERGERRVADELEELLDEGHIYVDPSIPHNGETDRLDYHRDITISEDVATPFHGNPRSRGSYLNPDNPRHLREIVNLARTLYHESIHRHQSTTMESIATSLSGCTTHEIEAWLETIDALNSWVIDLERRYLEAREFGHWRRALAILRTLKATADVRASYIGDYISADYGQPLDGWAEIQTRASAYSASAQEHLNELEPLLEPRAEEGAEKSVSSGKLDGDLKELTQKVVSQTRWATAEDIEVTLVGLGQPAGKIFDLTVTNKSDHEFRGCMRSGRVLIPREPTVQKMIVGQDLSIRVLPHSRETVSLHGYCLDHGLLPPPDGQSLEWKVHMKSDEFQEAVNIVKAGNELHTTGGYENPIQRPEKYRDTVIQRAIWYLRTQGQDNPADKELLKENLLEQLAQLPPEKQPSEEESQGVVDNIWDDVDLTIKKSQTF
jgi:hypothetical protein